MSNLLTWLSLGGKGKKWGKGKQKKSQGLMMSICYKQGSMISALCTWGPILQI